MSLRTETRHVFSGICVCGHSKDYHHGNVIMRRGASQLMESSVWYDECEHWGVNEGWKPCPTCPVGFVDKDDPLKEGKLAGE